MPSPASPSWHQQTFLGGIEERDTVPIMLLLSQALTKWRFFKRHVLVQPKAAALPRRFPDLAGRQSNHGHGVDIFAYRHAPCCPRKTVADTAPGQEFRELALWVQYLSRLYILQGYAECNCEIRVNIVTVMIWRCQRHRLLCGVAFFCSPFLRPCHPAGPFSFASRSVY